MGGSPCNGKFDESGDPVSAGGYRKEKRVGGGGRQTGVSEKQSSELFLDDDVAFLWQSAVLKREKIEHNPGDFVTVTLSGADFTGLVTEPDESKWKPGVLRMKRRFRHAIEMDRQASSSATASSEGSVLSTFTTLAARMKVTTTQKEDSDQLTLKTPNAIRKLKPQHSDS